MKGEKKGIRKKKLYKFKFLGESKGSRKTRIIHTPCLWMLTGYY